MSGGVQGTKQVLAEAQPRRIYTAADFEDEVRRLSNRELVAATASAILGAAIMESHPRSNNFKDDAFTDAAYAEAKRRGNPDLYQRAFNDAVRSQGHSGMVKQVSIPLDFGDPTLENSTDDALAGESRKQNGTVAEGMIVIKDETGVVRAELDPSLNLEEAARTCDVYARDIGYASLWADGTMLGHSDGEAFVTQ